MKKFLYAYIVLQVVSSITSFIALLSVSLVYALIVILVSLIGVAIPIAILKNMESAENLESEIFYLRSRVNALEKAMSASGQQSESGAPAEEYNEVSLGNWKCIKCGTINKQGTSRCERCKAAYSHEFNPTDDPGKKKKLNRWGI